MARTRTNNNSLSACLSLLVGGVVLPALLVSAEYYTVTGPNVRADSCTPRCVDSDSPGHWTCSDVVNAAGTALSVCNTFELDDHTCHFHMMSQQEVGGCLADNQLNVIIMGQSNGVGLMSSIFSWFNRNDNDTFNPLQWIDDLDNANNKIYGNYAVKDVAQIISTQVNLDANGLVKWRGGAASGGSIEEMMDLSAAMDKTTTGSKLNFFRCTQLMHMMDALDGLTYAGRQSEKAYLMMNVGSYFKSAEDWRAAIVQVLDRVKTEFPNLTIFMIAYSDPIKQPFNDVMLEVIDTYGASIPMHYVDTFNMVRSTNAPKTTGSHWVHMVNLQIFNRVLAFACASRGTVECEEQVIGSSNCQWDPLQTGWYLHWFKQCNYMTYTSNSPPFPTPPEPAGPSPEAPAAVPEGSVIVVPALGPNPNQASTPAPASATLTTPVAADACPNTVQGARCQGKGFTGSRCCAINYECKYIDEEFSACFPYGYEVNGVAVATSPCDDVFCSGRGYCTVDSLNRPECNCEDGVSVSRYGNCLLSTDPGMEDKKTDTVAASGTADSGGSGGGSSSSSSTSSTGVIVIAAVGSCVAFLCLGSVGVYLRIRSDRKLNPPPMLVSTKEMA